MVLRLSQDTPEGRRTGRPLRDQEIAKFNYRIERLVILGPLGHHGSFTQCTLE